WVDQREQDVDERGAREEPVSEPDRRPDPPAEAADRGEYSVVYEPQRAAADRGDYRVVDERERDPGEEVQDVAERLGPCSVGREGGAEQEREIHPSQVELVSRPQRSGEDERSREAPGQRPPEAHRSASEVIASAALISARWLRPWGMFPRKAPVAGSISSA